MQVYGECELTPNFLKGEVSTIQNCNYIVYKKYKNWEVVPKELKS